MVQIYVQKNSQNNLFEEKWYLDGCLEGGRRGAVRTGKDLESCPYKFLILTTAFGARVTSKVIPSSFLIPQTRKWDLEMLKTAQCQKASYKQSKMGPGFFVCPCFVLFCFVLFCFVSGPHPRHVEVPRLGVQSELLLPAYTTAIAIRDLSCICDLQHSS